MTAGKGWIALALVVFAGGKLWRLVLGAYLFGAMTYAQLSAQAGGIGIPAQFLSALPYAVTILAWSCFRFASARATAQPDRSDSLSFRTARSGANTTGAAGAAAGWSNQPRSNTGERDPC